MITNTQARTNLHEIAEGIYRINTPVDLPDGPSFSFNQYLLVDDAPLLFYTGPRRMFPLVREAIAAVLPVERLRYIGLSHFEADECGAMNEFLAAAPQAVPLCSGIAALVSVGDVADRPPRAMADGERLSLGRHEIQWWDTPQVPHGWDCGLLMDTTTGTFFCGDLFTQGGRGEVALTEGDILGPSEAFGGPMDYYAHSPNTTEVLLRLAKHKPRTLACMHGSAWQGDGGDVAAAPGGGGGLAAVRPASGRGEHRSPAFAGMTALRLHAGGAAARRSAAGDRGAGGAGLSPLQYGANPPASTRSGGR